VTTDADGRYAAYVPAGVPVGVATDRCPPGYSQPPHPVPGLPGEGPPLIVAGGETRTLPDVKLYRRGVLAGAVVAEGRPVASAVVEVRWDATQRRKPATVITDADGKFRVSGAPPLQPAAIRVRAGAMVNATVVHRPEELTGSVTLPVSAANAFRLRGRVTDGRGRPVARARLVVLCVIQPPQPAPGDGAAAKKAWIPALFAAAEVEALFTDAEGRFESGALWPECRYRLTVSAEGLASRHQPDVQGKAGQTHEFPTVVLTGTGAALAGTVVATDGKPLAGVTVLNSGDAPRRLTTTTDGAGRFSLSGLYDGPAVVVAHKPGFRRAYAVARPGGPEPKIVLRSMAEPPEAVSPISPEHRQAETALIRQLQDLVDKARAGRPKAPSHHDPWAEARKDLDAYITKQTQKDYLSASHTLLALACELAREDRAKALRVLRHAANAARQCTLPPGQLNGAMQGLPLDFAGMLRAQGLTHVARCAVELGAGAEAVGWLNEAEALAMPLPEMQRCQPLSELAAAWVTLDVQRTEKILEKIGRHSFQWDAAVSGIIGRIVKDHPARAVAWLDRFAHRDGAIADLHRSLVAVRLAASDLPRAVALADGIADPAYRGATLARLASACGKRDLRQAHGLIEKAALALAAEPRRAEDERDQRMEVSVYLLWQAEAVRYPDLASLVALALATRTPVADGDDPAERWRWRMLRLGVGVSTLDPAVGRTLLGVLPEPDALPDEGGETYAHEWFTLLALVDPAAALRHMGDLDEYAAAATLKLLRRRSAVTEHNDCLYQLGWMRDDGSFEESED
jgi:hypothetical protein